MTRPLEEIQDEIIDRLHAGQPVDREALCAEHPQHADALRRFFDLVDVIEEPPVTMHAEPSRLGEFKILREIGRGGMGIVYEAEQTSLSRRVALKVLPPALGRDPRLLARFQREAEAAGRLRHPNIVPVFSVGEAAGTPFFAMELVEGASAADTLHARRAGEETDHPAAGAEWRRWCIDVAAQVAEALAYAHEHGILHRDVKPGNIILERNGTPRLTDFGLALDLHAGALTMTGESFGTPQYMSPEQIARQEHPVDARTDVYSLAVTLYELLTLRIPYEAETGVELLAALQLGKIVSPRRVDPDIPPPVESVLLKALQVDPRDRYASAADFAADLRALLEERTPVASTWVAPASRKRVVSRVVPKGRGKNRWVPIAAAVLLAALLAFLVVEKRPSAPAKPTAQDWERLAQKGFSDNEAALRRWVRPAVFLRHYQRRAKPDRVYECRIEPVVKDRKGSGPARAILILAHWERSLDGEAWRGVGFSWIIANSETDSSANLEAAVQDVFGERRDKSVLVKHRARIQVLPLPAGWRNDRRAVVDAWDEGRTPAITWTDARTVLAVDEYPENYPAAVADAAFTRDFQSRLDNARFRASREDIQGSDGRFVVQCTGLGGPTRLPIAADVEAWSPDGKTRIGRGRFTWGTTGEWQDSRAFFINVETHVREAAAKARELKLRFRGSRQAAIEFTRFERYWSGEATARIALKWADPSQAEVDAGGRLRIPRGVPGINRRVEAALFDLRTAKVYESPNPAVQSVVVIGRQAVPALLRILTEPSKGDGPEIQKLAAADALAALALRRDIPILGQILKDGHLMAAVCFRNLRGPDARDALLGPLESGLLDTSVLDALAPYLRDPIALAAVVAYLKEHGADGPPGAGLATDFLARARALQALPALKEMLQTARNDRARRAFADALARLGHKDAITVLEDVLFNDEAELEVRHEAGLRLNEIYGQKIYAGRRETWLVDEEFQTRIVNTNFENAKSNLATMHKFGTWQSLVFDKETFRWKKWP